MTKEEKESIHTFLTTAHAWITKTGKASDIMPLFSDDIEPARQRQKPDVFQTDVFQTLDDIASAVHNCIKCGLCTTRKNTVAGEGVLHPLVLVIGEAPGADEDAQGLPFVGKAGQLLDKMLSAIALSRNTNCFIANTVKCRPPQNRDPLPDEISACNDFLQAQIRILQPRVILAVGRIATQILLHTTQGINALRGQWFDYNGIPLIATYHPSALLRNDDLKRPAWEDLKILKAKLAEFND